MADDREVIHCAPEALARTETAQYIGCLKSFTNNFSALYCCDLPHYPGPGANIRMYNACSSRTTEITFQTCPPFSRFNDSRRSSSGHSRASAVAWPVTCRTRQ